MSRLKIGVLGIDHRHAYGMLGNMLDQDAECVGWWTHGTPETLAGFEKRFPDAPRLPSVEAVLDAQPDLVIISAIPSDRASLAIRAMEAGADVMSDKPGCTTMAQLDAIKTCVAATGRIWSVDFSERFEVPCVTRAAELVAEGAVGRVIQTVGLGPHRLNRATRPDWFFDPSRNGGILTDIASHQIDQFLFFTGATDAEITLASARAMHHDFQDFGEIALRAPEDQGGGHGYIRVDWFTPDALPTWGDGRLTILGTEGTIELRKYVDIGAGGSDTLTLVNGTRCEKIDASDAGLPYFARLAADIRDRTETAMPQAHAFKVMELALRAQAMADAGA
ncbi:putative dehydrogenase [Litoreibacter ponti]|uniref:Putative dehydrogenase n=1 Tax=Litoreibacter ponti TaxID=1510457 RepID=A0A2T6BDV6_9RHOB|nr:Gfo/Idh/MocA family oxidoreductase [Litoreibacter ponti]PTX54214.1 putative dehydrogenase [Litoreibacter ponti]